MKRVILVHRWYGSPEADWYPWLKQELESKEITVLVPAMPTPDAPEIKTWNSALAKAVGKPDMDTYLIGHSVGCQTILRYLEQAAATARVGGCVFVAGFFDLQGIETEEEERIAKSWLETPINCNKIKTHTKRIVTIFSDNDPFVKVDQAKLFEQRLQAKTIIESKKGHFSGSDGVKELPNAFKAVLEMAK